jgi:lipopolysaccharide cholinephosphotransferase
MNTKIAREMSLLSHKEWSKVKKKFWKYDVSKKINNKEYTHDLLDVKEILDEENIDNWLIFGTLLGAVRDKDFLSWDDNINFAVYKEDFLPKIETIKEKFISYGFIFRLIPKKRGLKINLHRYKHRVALEALFLDSSYKNNKYRCSDAFKHPRKYFEKKGFIEFKGEIFRVPSPVKDYLSFLYQDWKTPIKLKDLSNPSKWRNKKNYVKK